MSKESFKVFAKTHPELASSVMKGTTSWQKLYELFDIYGESSSVWDKYLNTTPTSVSTTFKDLFNTVRNIDLDSVQKGVNNLQKTIGLLQDIGLGSTTKEAYEARPMYKYFED